MQAQNPFPEQQQSPAPPPGPKRTPSLTDSQASVDSPPPHHHNFPRWAYDSSDREPREPRERDIRERERARDPRDHRDLREPSRDERIHLAPLAPPVGYPSERERERDPREAHRLAPLREEHAVRKRSHSSTSDSSRPAPGLDILLEGVREAERKERV